ncbi:MAG: DNA cytosine methyltransferase [Promethearchaeota archaeon]
MRGGVESGTEGRLDPWFVDLFAGCGGFSRGLLDAGWRHVVANEVWEPAARTYEENVSPNLVVGDIRDDGVFRTLVDATRGREPLVVVGGPPCQGFSMAGNRNPVDPRGQLWKRFVDFVGATRPVAFVMENVKGLVSMKHLDEGLDPETRERVQEAARHLQRHKDLRRYGRQRDLTGEERAELESLQAALDGNGALVRRHLVPLLPEVVGALERAGPGYVVQYRVLNAAHYGVPQFRERVFIIGYRGDVHAGLAAHLGPDFPFHPAPTHADHVGAGPGKGLKPLATVEDAIGDLADVPEGALPNHQFTRSKPSFVEKIARTRPGETVYPHYTDAWYRLLPNRPARTVKENHGGVHCHPVQPRTLTPRELARLQSFPDDFVFLGTKSSTLVQIGNAVPPLLAEAVGKAVGAVLGSAPVSSIPAPSGTRGTRRPPSGS